MEYLYTVSRADYQLSTRGSKQGKQEVPIGSVLFASHVNPLGDRQ